MPTVTKDSGPGVAVIAVLLAACGGATDVFSFFGLGKAFASIVTGNLVTAGRLWSMCDAASRPSR